MSTTQNHHNPFRKLSPRQQFSLDELYAQRAGRAPAGYASRWQQWYAAALEVDPQLAVHHSYEHDGWRVKEFTFQSTDGVTIGGWLIEPLHQKVERIFLCGHGYGGRGGPDFGLPFENAAYFFPCARGISKSPHHQISHEPKWHVLHDLQDPERYIMRGCCEDFWVGVTAIQRLYPHLSDKLYYLGISLSGGVGCLALAWEKRIAKAHVNVPTFGHQQLRLQVRSVGSAASVQKFARQNPGVAEKTLRWFDAAIAARQIRIPIHFACALADPAVTPLGQFAIYNAVKSKKQLFVLNAGHLDYPEKAEQDRALRADLVKFFA